ncbi:MAG TPA: hypothetical protein VD833_18485 [Vicinamibacterales bacterium]|nr:hypothetical protein [Vicinamibacterales bacterium]
MSRAAGRALAVAALGALAGGAWLAFFYGIGPALHASLDVTPPASLVSGLYPAERERESGLTFAWTGAAMTLRLPGLDRHVPWLLTVRVRGARPGNDNPELTFFVDGVRVGAHRSGPAFETVEMRVPARPERDGVTIEMRSSATFVPGPADPRPLGAMLDWVTLSPAGVVLPPRASFGGTVLASALFGAAIALSGVTAGAAVGSVILVSAGQAALVSRGFGSFTDYPATIVRLAGWIGLALVALALGAQAWGRTSLRNTARFAAIFAASALLLKAAVLLHPGMPIGDALFHAHRFRTVAAGNVYFTSIAPGNYLFPYAPGLYVFSLFFRSLLAAGTEDMQMLRLVVLSADAAASLLLYGAVARMWRDRLAGACAVALYHLLPLDFRVVTVGNLTNAFAQAIGVGVLVWTAAAALRVERRAEVAGFAGLLTAAFLSHLSAFAIFAVAVPAIALLFHWRGGPAMRSPALALLAGTGLAVVAAVALYYAHFMDTYRTELARIGAETASAAPAAGGRTIGDRLVDVPRFFYLHFGVPALVLAAVGSHALWRQGSRDRLTLATAGLGLACLGFLVLGVITPVDMRHYLAAIPAVALVAGLGASQLWARNLAGRLVAITLLGWATLIGIHTWWETIP